MIGQLVWQRGEDIDEVPPHKRLPSRANVPDVKSIDDLI